MDPNKYVCRHLPFCEYLPLYKPGIRLFQTRLQHFFVVLGVSSSAKPGINSLALFVWVKSIISLRILNRMAKVYIPIAGAMVWIILYWSPPIVCIVLLLMATPMLFCKKEACMVVSLPRTIWPSWTPSGSESSEKQGVLPLCASSRPKTPGGII